MDIGKILQTEITEEMQKSYLDYAMSVIVARALPDVRDGLKPVHRRILYAMHQMGLAPNSSFTKSAKVVGEVLGKYHPHGDMPVYDALVRLAQDFSMRYPLVWGQGNFGSVDGDPPAAMRYTEVKLRPITLEALTDIEKNTVDFVENFDATLKEPLYLPSQIPNLLLMGSEGIAVGMATKIPPHNLGEVVEAVLATIKKGKIVHTQESETKEREQSDFFIRRIDLAVKSEFDKKAPQEDKIESPGLPSYDFTSEVTLEELLEKVKGPDFPTFGSIYDSQSLVDVYSTGRGRIVVRGVAKIEEGKAGRQKIVISELPYQVNKALLVAKIADLVKNKKIVGVADLRDESDRAGMSVVLELKRDSRPKSILNNLYKHTSLQTTFPANFVALVDGVPRTLNLKQILVEYVRHRQKVVTKRTVFELTEAKKRAHILEGLKIALDNLDAVILTIRKSRDSEEAKINLVNKFDLSQTQAIAILDMQLRRLAALEREKIEKEYEEVKKIIDRLSTLLKFPEKVLDVIGDELIEIKKKYADLRRTRIHKSAIGEFSQEDLVAKEEILITVTKTGYLKRVPKGTYKAQRRGGKGVVGMATKEEDEISQLVSGTTHDRILFFTNLGRVFALPAWEIPESSRQSKGQAIVNLINLGPEEKLQVLIPIANGGDQAKYLFMATKRGVVKKTRAAQFQALRSSGIIAIRLEGGDQLSWVKPTNGEDHILLVSRLGQSIRFSEEDVRPLSRVAAGVRGILLKEDDEVVGTEVFSAKAPKQKDLRKKTARYILVVSEKGLGKRTPLESFPTQKRAGSGVKIANLNEKTGRVAGAILTTGNTEQVVITSKSGQIIKLRHKNIPSLGRATQGVILMRFAKKGDLVAAITSLIKDQDNEPQVKKLKSV